MSVQCLSLNVSKPGFDTWFPAECLSLSANHGHLTVTLYYTGNNSCKKVDKNYESENLIG